MKISQRIEKSFSNYSVNIIANINVQEIDQF